MNNPVISVSQLNRYIKSVVDGDINLQNVFVSGEISNFTAHRSGHYYLTLKDENASVKAVMFRSANAHLRFVPENSMKVIVRGRISVFERDGQYQLYIDDMQPDGMGALSVAFEQLKKKLAAEGLFDEAHKKAIPKYPSRVGVITSATGAAVRDIINVLSRRFPLAQMVFCPVTVQGELAPGEICSAVEAFNLYKCADVIILGRGGGSAEDLWAFNDEDVARAVYNSEIPVISAVGHETDFTICDFVSDLRAPTPSAGAELAVPEIGAEIAFVNSVKLRLSELAETFIGEKSTMLGLLGTKLEKNSPSAYLTELRFRCDKAVTEIEGCAKSVLNEKKLCFSKLCAGLEELSPLKIMARGYSVAEKDGQIIKATADVDIGDNILLRLSDGKLNCTVTGKEQYEH